MVETIKRGFGSNKVILFSVVAIIITVILGLAYNYGFKRIDVISKFESAIRLALNENIDNLKNLNLSEKSLEEFKFVLTKSVDVVIVGLPATIFILSIAATIVNYLISVNFFEVAQIPEIFLRHRLHTFEAFFLHVVRKFEIVDSNTMLAVGRNRTTQIGRASCRERV